MANHQSLVDFLVVLLLKHNEQVSVPVQVNFFSWFNLWRVPTIKTIYHMIKCDENWELSQSWTTQIFGRVVESAKPEWVVLFPEVNIHSPVTAYLQRLQSERYGLPYFDHVLYPRYSGILNAITAVNTASDKFRRFYDLSISYDLPRTLVGLFASKPVRATVRVRSWPISKVPRRRKRLEKFIESIWVAKENALEKLQAERKSVTIGI